MVGRFSPPAAPDSPPVMPETPSIALSFNGTQAPQLVVEAVADPRGRPRALAATDDLPPDEFVFYSSVILGDADRAARVVHDLDRGTDVMDNVMWWDLARPFRKTAGFRQLVRDVGLEQLWRVRGWPDKCRPKGAGDFVCD